MTNWVEFKTSLMRNLFGEQYEFVGQHQGIDAQVAALIPQFAQATYGKYQSGNYYLTSSITGGSTANTLGVGVLRLTPWIVPNNVTLNRIGTEITSAGEAGSKVRLGIYADNGNSYPGSLVIDAGVIDGTIVNVQDATVNQYIPAGIYWIGGVVQLAPTTQPGIRIASGWQPPVQLTTGTTIGTGAGTIAYSMAGVTASLPQSFSSTLSGAGAVPRLHVKVA